MKTFDNKKYYNKFLDTKIHRETIAENYFYEYKQINGEYPSKVQITEDIKSMSKWLHKDQRQLERLITVRQVINVIGIELFISTMEV